jgi:hypothetical protein
MEAKYKTMTRPCFICHFFDKTCRHFSYWRHENRFIQVLQRKILQGERVSPKLPLFVITNFFYARKSRFFSSLPTRYRGAWGAAPAEC